ncbi:hypothetical protein ABZZ20_31155 [Streptomyces sp. NPDC006430]|uniref:hypothetical protein n=1 Tax=Streptomyces sp. NPDC006430 TaxID=3154299 RepID=UPI0033BCC304
MRIIELAVRTYGITRALGLSWAPPDGLSAANLARLFPDVPSRHRPSDALLWCTGRIPLPGVPRRAERQRDGTVR